MAVSSSAQASLTKAVSGQPFFFNLLKVWLEIKQDHNYYNLACFYNSSEYCSQFS